MLEYRVLRLSISIEVLCFELSICPLVFVDFLSLCLSSARRKINLRTPLYPFLTNECKGG